MFSSRPSFKKAHYNVTYLDFDWIKKKGWLATRRDGTTEWVNQETLNIPTHNMWRLYYQRTKKKGPPYYNDDHVNWHRRLLVIINKSYGRQPEDANFIISLNAKSEQYIFNKRPLAYKESVPNIHVAKWNEAWGEDFR